MLVTQELQEMAAPEAMAVVAVEEEMVDLEIPAGAAAAVGEAAVVPDLGAGMVPQAVGVHLLNLAAVVEAVVPMTVVATLVVLDHLERLEVQIQEILVPMVLVGTQELQETQDLQETQALRDKVLVQ